ncbi:MAG TPA: DUF4382 domain-containing protein [Pseudothermotoga sp.]
MKQLFLVVIVLSVLLITGCMNLSSSKGTLTVYLTDAVLPISDVQRIDVTIDKILLMSDTASVVVTDEATTVNLLDLVGSEISFPTLQTSGTYTQLRLEISQATITVNNEDHELRISSGSLKYPFTEPLEINQDTILVLDFDLSRSIKVTGSWGQGQGTQQSSNTEYHMTPVIHLRYGQLYDITGKVVDNNSSNSSGIAHALIALTNDSTVVAATFSHEGSNKWEKGEFKLSKIKPGNYEIKVFLKETYECWEGEDIDQYILQQTPDATRTVNLGYEDLDVGEISISN